MAVGSVGGTYGLSGSGMDIDSIVKSLMTAQQAKADALLQKKTVTEWQKAAYNTVYDDISNFRTSVFNYKLQGTLSPNKVSSSNTSVATVTANSGAVDVNHSLVVTQLADGVKLTSTAPISTLQPPTLGTLVEQLGMPTTSFNITITNGTAPSKSFTIDPNSDTINDVVSKFNNAGANVKVNYDSTLDRVFLTTTNTGIASGVSFEGSDPAGLAFLGKQLKLPNLSTTDSGVTYTNVPKVGKDAIFQLDEASLTQASNSFTISGVTYNLTGVSATPVNISVTNDTDSAVASIQSLVDSYNKILEEVNGKVNETRYKDFAPLSVAQKAAMKEADITAWETKAKSGMLRNDPTLASLVNTMRSAFSNPVSGIDGPYNSGVSIGITTGNYTEGGKLYLDTDKLRTALNTNPDVVNQLFGATGTDASSQGIAGRLYDGIKTKIDELKQIAGTSAGAQYDTNSSYAKRLTSYNLQISNAADRFDTVEKAYYRKFNAMELALQQMNSQSSWLQSFGTTS